MNRESSGFGSQSNDHYCGNLNYLIINEWLVGCSVGNYRRKHQPHRPGHSDCAKLPPLVKVPSNASSGSSKQTSNVPHRPGVLQQQDDDDNEDKSVSPSKRDVNSITTVTKHSPVRFFFLLLLSRNSKRGQHNNKKSSFLFDSPVCPRWEGFPPHANFTCSSPTTSNGLHCDNCVSFQKPFGHCCCYVSSTSEQPPHSTALYARNRLPGGFVTIHHASTKSGSEKC